MIKLLTHTNTPQKVTSVKYNNDPKRLSRHYDFLILLQQLTSMTSLKVAQNHFMARADWVLIVHRPITHESLRRNVNNIWHLWCIFSFIIFFHLSIETSFSLVASSLQHYVCITSTRSDWEKSHNNDYCFTDLRSYQIF